MPNLVHFLTLTADGGVALVARRTLADGTVRGHVADSAGAAVARVLAAAVDARLGAGTLAIGTTAESCGNGTLSTQLRDGTARNLRSRVMLLTDARVTSRTGVSGAFTSVTGYMTVTVIRTIVHVHDNQ